MASMNSKGIKRERETGGGFFVRIGLAGCDGLFRPTTEEWVGGILALMMIIEVRISMKKRT